MRAQTPIFGGLQQRESTRHAVRGAVVRGAASRVRNGHRVTNAPHDVTHALLSPVVTPLPDRTDTILCNGEGHTVPTISAMSGSAGGRGAPSAAAGMREAGKKISASEPARTPLMSSSDGRGMLRRRCCTRNPDKVSSAKGLGGLCGQEARGQVEVLAWLHMLRPKNEVTATKPISCRVV